MRGQIASAVARECRVPHDELVKQLDLAPTQADTGNHSVPDGVTRLWWRLHY